MPPRSLPHQLFGARVKTVVWLSASLSPPDIWIWMLVLLLPARKSKSSNGLKTYCKFSRYLSGGTYFCNFSFGKSCEGRNLSCWYECPPQAMDFPCSLPSVPIFFQSICFSFVTFFPWLCAFLLHTALPVWGAFCAFFWDEWWTMRRIRKRPDRCWNLIWTHFHLNLGWKVDTFPGSIFLQATVSSSPFCSSICDESHISLPAKPGY